MMKDRPTPFQAHVNAPQPTEDVKLNISVIAPQMKQPAAVTRERSYRCPRYPPKPDASAWQTALELVMEASLAAWHVVVEPSGIPFRTGPSQIRQHKCVFTNTTQRFEVNSATVSQLYGKRKDFAVQDARGPTRRIVTWRCSMQRTTNILVDRWKKLFISLFEHGCSVEGEHGIQPLC